MAFNYIDIWSSMNMISNSYYDYFEQRVVVGQRLLPHHFVTQFMCKLGSERVHYRPLWNVFANLYLNILGMGLTSLFIIYLNPRKFVNKQIKRVIGRLFK